MLEINWDEVEDFTNEGEGSRAYNTPLVSIMRTGNINFRSGFVFSAAEQMKDAGYVLLSFHKPTSTIIFDFVNDGQFPGALKLTKTVSNKSISMKNFMRKFQIDIKKVSGSYVAELLSRPNGEKRWAISLENNRA